MKGSLSKIRRNRVLVLPIGSSEDVGRVTFTEQEVDDIQEALECPVVEVVTNRDESSRDAACYSDSVLGIQIC